MKIIKRIEFLKLPAGTLFSAYEPCFFGPLLIKGDTIQHDGRDIDFFEQQIADAVDCFDSGEFVKLLDASQNTGSSVPMDFNCEGRDGLFEPDYRLYAVWERQDVEALIARLQATLGKPATHLVDSTGNAPTFNEAVAMRTRERLDSE